MKNNIPHISIFFLEENILDFTKDFVVEYFCKKSVFQPSPIHPTGFTLNFSFFINIPNSSDLTFYTPKQGYPYIPVERSKTPSWDHFSTKNMHFSPIFADLIS